MNWETRREAVRKLVTERDRGPYLSLRRGWSRFASEPLGVVALGVVVAATVLGLVTPFLETWSPLVHDPAWQAPSYPNDLCERFDCLVAESKFEHPAPPKFGDPYWAILGTDHSGHDVLTQLLWGTRTATAVGLAAGLLSVLVGVPVGVASGVYRWNRASASGSSENRRFS